MLSKAVVRYASRTSFKLPPINFKHSKHPSATTTTATEDIPVITTPVTHEDTDRREKRRHGKNWEGESRRHEPRKSFAPSWTNHIKNTMISENESRDNNYVNFQNYKSEKRKGLKVRTNQTVEDNLRYMGMNISGEVIHGIFPVLLALQAKRRTLHHVMYKDGRNEVSDKMQDILDAAKEQGIPVTSLKPSQFKRIFQGDQVHQGVCCDASSLPFVILDEEHVEKGSSGERDEGGKKRKLWLYLDQIQDPMNFGAVLRSAYFMGVERVITSAACSAKVTSTVSKASAGVAEVLPVHQVEDPVKLASSLTQAGWDVVSSAAPGSSSDTTTRLTDVTAFTPSGSVLLIVGNEGKGITPELQQVCHTALTIEPGRTLHPHLHCLNVSVATALLLHSLRQTLNITTPTSHSPPVVEQ